MNRDLEMLMIQEPHCGNRIGPPSTQQINDAALKNVLLMNALQYSRNCGLSREDALAWAAIVLAEQNERLMAEIDRLRREQPRHEYLPEGGRGEGHSY